MRDTALSVRTVHVSVLGPLAFQPLGPSLSASLSVSLPSPSSFPLLPFTQYLPPLSLLPSITLALYFSLSLPLCPTLSFLPDDPFL